MKELETQDTQDTVAMLEIGASPINIIARAQEQARALMDVVEKQGLYQNIRGHKYLNVEAWQLLGAFTGYTAVIECSNKVESEDDVVYEARAVIVDKDGIKVSAGESECARSENGKGWMSNNQIRSTAQTRAVSKAYRLKLGFIAKLAGFEATPAEEIDDNGFPKEEDQTSKASAPATLKTAETTKTTPPENTSGDARVGVTVRRFNEVKEECLKHVNMDLVNQIAGGLNLKGRRLSEMSEADMETLITACKNFGKTLPEEEAGDEPVEPFPTGPNGREGG